ncbi:uncharacterized protein LOC115764328 [Drosophila novamexicana]|uniref:uncharacterized protein LOC115764328 n=1 Tax=Drosophila novamexicana TaxID=47314 RepID=UPI0011E5F955|nr:uncharacterized protein LOC115764328 [Drosophila novamexicana]
MGAARSQPIIEEDVRAYSKFLEKFKDTHSYLSENEVEQNAVMTWDTMTPEQKSQFLNNEEKARAYIKHEYIPKNASTRTIPKPKPKQKVKPKPKKKPIAAKTKITTSRKSQKAINSKTKGKNMHLSHCSNNAFRHFIREFRKRNSDLDLQTAVKLGAKAWCLLYQEEREMLKKLITKKGSISDVSFMYL